MPALPTFTVSDSAATRILNAFKGQTDYNTGAALTPMQAYKRWLRDSLIRHVKAVEAETTADPLESEMTL